MFMCLINVICTYVLCRQFQIQQNITGVSYNYVHMYLLYLLFYLHRLSQMQINYNFITINLKTKHMTEFPQIKKKLNDSEALSSEAIYFIKNKKNTDCFR